MGISRYTRRMRTYGWTIFFMLAALLAAGAAWYVFGLDAGKEASCRDRVPQPTIVAFGDSLVLGTGAATPGGFVSLLSAQAGISIRNFGRSGDTAASAAQRVDAALAAEPDVVLVLLGGNDALRRVPPAATEANLDAILVRFREAGARVVLLGVMGDLFNDPYPSMFERLAETHDATYVPNVLSGLLGRSEFMSDAIHPNEAGHARIAERVLPALEAACAEYLP